MEKAIKTTAILTGKTELQPDIFSFWFKNSDLETSIANTAVPGQFVMVYLKDKSKVLPRPISICEVDKKNGLFRLIFRIMGEGTKELSKMEVGEYIEILGPLGNGFLLPQKEEQYLIVGGGIGIFPLLELVKQLHGTKQIVLGYRNKDTFLVEEFQKYGQVQIATDDGSLGTQGTVIDALKNDTMSYQMIFACGPLPMLKGVKQIAKKYNIPAQISMEERMACGIGACLGCVCKSTELDPHSNVYNKRVCKDGPVFFSDAIEF